MSGMSTIAELTAVGQDDAPALLAPGRTALTYGELRALTARTGRDLAAFGLGRGDRIAIVLPNGPAMASCFLAVAAHATAAPLNPAYKAEEFAFYLRDLGARALVAETGSEGPAVAAARDLAIPVIGLTETPDGGAGSFSLAPPPGSGSAAPTAALAKPDDVALILHTSGTTSRPKIVPLSQRNVCVSAGNIARSLRLGSEDRGLGIMPLFHIHGLIAGLLAPLSAGGSVYCTPGFNALRVFGWLAESGATWVTAVPTMHQAILTRAAGNREVIAAHPLRFLRSSSSSMPPQVIAEIERVFGAPLIEAYGMTEASHQMTSNPLDGIRKPGAVGLAAGPEIAILDEDGRPLGPGEAGEVAIRGENVTAGYEGHPEANASAFTNGWFRTGDQGVLDAEGYLTLTGRLKEIINRGGEKVSPREVDEALMDHPAVLQVVTFAVPHPKLGEEVAAAIVLREGMSATEAAIRAFAESRMASYKVPRRVVFLDEIPKGATGKLQRIGLAAKLGL